MRISMLLVVFIASISMIGTATAAPTVLIHPDTDTIDVPIAPNAVSPPLDIEYLDFGTSGGTYSVVLVRDSDGTVLPNCNVAGTITSNDQHVTLGSCVIPSSEHGKSFHVYAEGNCAAGVCNSKPTRSAHVIIDAPVIPTPELGTTALMSVGLVGLGLLRIRRKE